MAPPIVSSGYARRPPSRPGSRPRARQRVAGARRCHPLRRQPHHALGPAWRAGSPSAAASSSLGFEFEYSDTREDPEDAAPSLRTGMGNILLQTPIAIAGLQPYFTSGAGGYRETARRLQRNAAGGQRRRGRQGAGRRSAARALRLPRVPPARRTAAPDRAPVVRRERTWRSRAEFGVRPDHSSLSQSRHGLLAGSRWRGLFAGLRGFGRRLLAGLRGFGAAPPPAGFSRRRLRRRLGNRRQVQQAAAAGHRARIQLPRLLQRRGVGAVEPCERIRPRP